MGKKVTYAIAFAKASPFAEEIRQHKHRLKSLQEEGNHVEAARTNLEIAYLLIEQCDQIDPDTSPEEQEEEKCGYLYQALKYCDKAHSTLDAQSNADDLARMYELSIQCYQRLSRYEQAVAKAKSLVSFLRRQSQQDMVRLQAALKCLGDIFYQRGHDVDNSRHDDFGNAQEYYLKERAILDNLTEKDFDNDKAILMDLIRSSNFNLGVIESKFPGHEPKAEEYLVNAIKQAKKLKDIDSERKTWWELGNVFKRINKSERVLQCQYKELQIIQRHHVRSDLIPCLYELIKTHLEREEYAKCLELCREMRAVVSDEEDECVDDAVDMVLKMQHIKREIAKTVSGGNVDLLTRSSLWLDLAQQQLEADMSQPALISVTYGLEGMEGFQDPFWSQPLCVNRVLLFQIRADAQWKLHFMSFATLVELNTHIVSMITSSLKSAREQSRQLQRVCERLVSIHQFYNRPEECKQWRRRAKEAASEWQSLPESDEEDVRAEDPVESMNVDDDDDDDDDNDILFLGTSNNVTEVAPPTFHVPELAVASKLSVYVSVPLGEKEQVLLIPCQSEDATVEWLADETVRRAWETYSVSPRIVHMQLAGGTLYPRDLIRDVVKSDKERISAIVSGYEQKPFAEIYEHVCTRLHIPLEKRVMTRLEKSANTTLLSLANTGIKMLHIPLWKEFFNLAQPTITRLDLTGNMIVDEDVEKIVSCLSTLEDLDLRSNDLTIRVYDTLCKYGPTVQLTALYLGFNNLGPSALDRLPELLTANPLLTKLDLSSTELGGKTQLSDKTEHTLGGRTQTFARTTLILDNNAFQQDMLTRWTPLLSRLFCLQEISFAGVTTEMPWANTHLLTKIPGLSTLSLSGVHASSLVLSDLRDMLQMSLSVTHLDFTFCDLNCDDLTTIAQGVSLCNSLKVLRLQGNTRLGDQGMDTLRTVLGQSVSLDAIDLSFCQLTRASYNIIQSWTGPVSTFILENNPLFCASISDLEALVDIIDHHCAVQCVQITSPCELPNLSIDVSRRVNIEYNPKPPKMAITQT